MPALDYEKVASLYDALVREEADARFFVSLSKRASGRILELMAGTGRVSVPVAAAGADLTCLDSSEAMLEVLRRKLATRRLTVDVVQQDVTQLDLPSPFSLTFIAFNSFEELTDDRARGETMRRIFAHLVPGGTFVCTLHDPDVRLQHVGPGREIRRCFTDGAGRELEMCVTTAYDEESALVVGRQRFKDRTRGNVILDLPLRFRLSSREEFGELAERFGFRVEALYGEYDRGSYRAGASSSMIWVLSRPAGLSAAGHVDEQLRNS